MGQGQSDAQPQRRSREQLAHELARKFQALCFTSLEQYCFNDVFQSLADHQDEVRYIKEDTLARFLELPDILAASPVVFQIVSYLGAFPFLQDAPVVMEHPRMIIALSILTERYRRVLAKGSRDRTKLLFKSLAVFDRKASEAGIDTSEKPEASTASSHVAGFAVDEAGADAEDADEDDLVLETFELLDINHAVMEGDAPAPFDALIPTDNFRKLLLLLLLVAPLEPQERLSRYTARVTGDQLESLRTRAEHVLASFVDPETSPGIKYSHFIKVIPVLCPNLFNGFNALFEHFLFSKNLDFSQHKDEKPEALPMVQPLIKDTGDILDEHTLSQISLFLPGSDLFHRVRLLYSGNQAGFSMRSFETKVFNWRAPTILLVRGTRLSRVPEGGQEAAFADSIPPNRFPPGSKSDSLTFGVFVKQPWKHTFTECFGDSDTVLFQLEPVHDVFAPSKLNQDFVAFTKTFLGFGCPPPKKTQSHRREEMHSLGAVSLLLNDSFEFGVFNHNYRSRGGAFQTSVTRRYDFQDRFQIESMEVWGCGGDAESKAQAEQWAWEEREAEARRRINLGSGDIEADRALLEMAGLVGNNRSGGSMG
ncbi:TLDc domain-containing protein 2 [Stachybotrys elegans]|uniref:Restriction of telomere capping protein 5 n=1 Tax=Stachybotrys elegans TaxID=80388 RepID=A0A8K0SKZ9_9HYPO|nr:TLDc domain-containing protein 2 [Stachybotrys elegans]